MKHEDIDAIIALEWMCVKPLSGCHGLAGSDLQEIGMPPKDWEVISSVDLEYLCIT